MAEQPDSASMSNQQANEVDSHEEENQNDTNTNNNNGEGEEETSKFLSELLFSIASFHAVSSISYHFDVHIR